MVSITKYMISRICVFSLVLLMYSCKSDKLPIDSNNINSTSKVEIVQEWFPNANYAGEVYALYATDSINGVDFEIIPGSDLVDPIKAVLSGTADIGVAGADKVLLANSKGADLVVIGVINHNSPTCFLSLKEKNIKGPLDFTGKKVGVLSGTATEYVYKSLLKQVGLESSQFIEQEAPFDLKSFIAGQYDVRPAFIYDEPVTLDKLDIEYDIIYPQEYGVSFIGTVYFTKRSYVENNRPLIQSIINSISEGWEQAIIHPEKAIEYLHRFDPSIDTNREYDSFIKGLEYFKGYNNNVLTTTQKQWSEMIDDLDDISDLTKESVSAIYDSTFIYRYHQK